MLHLDPNEYYGGPQASLTLDELAKWSSNQASTSKEGYTAYSSATCSTIEGALERDCRRYALSLYPSVLASRGELIDTLIRSDVSKYVSFHLLDSVSIWTNAAAGLKRVPGSKEDVFKDKSASLIDKRRLMKFLMFAGGEFEGKPELEGKEDIPLADFLRGSFSLPEHLVTAVAYGLAHCTSPQDATLPSLIRARRYLRSIGRYGSGAFLVGQYGGAGELAQGFCR